MTLRGGVVPVSYHGILPGLEVLPQAKTRTYSHVETCKNCDILRTVQSKTRHKPTTAREETSNSTRTNIVRPIGARQASGSIVTMPNLTL